MYGPSKVDNVLTCLDCEACKQKIGYHCEHPMMLKENGKSRKISTYPVIPEWCPANSDFA